MARPPPTGTSLSPFDRCFDWRSPTPGAAIHISPGAGCLLLPPREIHMLVQGPEGSTFPPLEFSQVVLGVGSGLKASQH